MSSAIPAAFFSGQLELPKTFQIEPLYRDYCVERFQFDPNVVAERETTAERHLRLVASTLGLYKSWSTASASRPAYFLGYSVGQYSALAAAGAIDWQQALEIVHERARCLDQAKIERPSKLLTVLGLPEEKIAPVLASHEGRAFIAARNSAMNLSIGVVEEDADKVGKELLSLKPIRVAEQPDCGAWHTPLMSSALKRFEAFLEAKLSHVQVSGKLVENIDAEVVDLAACDRAKLIALLVESVAKPVAFSKMINTLVALGTSEGIEFGLNPFLAKIAPFVVRTFRLTPYTKA